VDACPLEIGILEGAIERLRGEWVKTGKGSYTQYNETFRQLVARDGVVNPLLLLLRCITLNTLFRNVVTGAKFFIKGKISLRRKRIPDAHQLRTIGDRLREGP
jgi:stalled ribosome alternative rescue factor ArfA